MGEPGEPLHRARRQPRLRHAHRRSTRRTSMATSTVCRGRRTYSRGGSRRPLDARPLRAARRRHPRPATRPPLPMPDRRRRGRLGGQGRVQPRRRRARRPGPPPLPSRGPRRTASPAPPALGLAVSDDGITSRSSPSRCCSRPTIRGRRWEWPGGCEDPRVVASPDGGFVCLYTAFDGRPACSASPPHPTCGRGPSTARPSPARAHEARWSKSGAVVTDVVDGRARRHPQLDGRFWMYWGEGTCFAATSDDLVRWEPVEIDATADRRIELDPTTARGASHRRARPARPPSDPRAPPRPLRLPARRARAAGGAHRRRHRPHLQRRQPPRPRRPVAARPVRTNPARCSSTAASPAPRSRARPNRSSAPPQPTSASGQVDDVCFAQALVLHDGRWLLYYGMADAKIGLATAVA